MPKRTPVAPEEVETVARRLEQVAILRSLTDDLKLKLARRLTWVDLLAGESIFGEGDPGESLYLIDSGAVTVFLTDDDLGLTYELTRFRSGQVFGEMSLITGDVRSASVSAAEPTRLIEVSRKLFYRLIQTAPQVGLAIARDLARRVEDLNQDQRVRFASLRGVEFDRRMLDLVPHNLILRFRMVPIEEQAGVVTVATPEPYNRVGLDEIRRVLRGQVLRVLGVSESDFTRFMRDKVEREVEHGPETAEALRRTVAQRVREVQWLGTSRDRRVDDSSAGMNTKALGELVDSIIVEALERDASDIHIEPEREEVVIRFRVDGRMVRRDGRVPPTLLNPILSRIKVLSGLDITERRLPQDGRMSMRVGHEQFDLRVATVATRQGEKCSLRLMDSHRLAQDLSALILDPETLELARRLVFQTSGLLLVTGPSGSGKTTTLYNAVGERNVPEVSIATVEDPVEYDIPGVTQVQVNEALGLTFPVALRAFLRQTPDVIMVGETRDQQTADILGNAALTGHMVMSSFHTNDALGALARLADMKVEPFVMANALNGVINQRLVRRICDGCRTAVELSASAHRSLQRANVLLEAGTPVYQGDGCTRCAGEGYRGRVGIYEVMSVEQPLREAIAEQANVMQLRQAAGQCRYISLADYAARLLRLGLTSPTEVLRVLPMSTHG